MHASLVRRNLSGLVPPKIASPSILVSPLAASLTTLTKRKFTTVFFYLFIFIFFLFLYSRIRRTKSAGKGSDLSPLVAFYSKLPKGPAPEPAVRGIKARYF